MILFQFTGVWLFHCHIEWHVASGLSATMVEAPLDLQQSLSIPANHFDACSAASPPVPTVGNAAGNTENLLDLTGEPAPPPRLPDGFTARGIVALVFSCVAGVLGVAVVAWYGMVADPNAGEDGAAGGAAAASNGGGVFQQSSNEAAGAQGVEQVTVTSGGGAGVSKT